tara:strand:+ start:7099 stop:7344 length:246 start_codon:yes stop_codon:yes gene_type:complete
LLPPLVALGSWSMYAWLAALALVVLSQLARIYLVLLELAARLWAGRLWWWSFLGLEVGVRHAYNRQFVPSSRQAQTYSTAH